MKQTILLFFTILLPMMANADVVEIDELAYELNNEDHTATVAYKLGDSEIVTIPESILFNEVSYSVTSIGEEALYECQNVTSVSIPNTVVSIGNFAFYGCNSLSNITIPHSVTSIGIGAFKECSDISSITIPKSVTTIGNYVFSDCVNLTSIVVEDGNGFYDSRENCNAIIESSSGKLISGCKNTIIPNSVTSIGTEAFYGTELTNIVIPNSVTSIEEEAFAYCTGLKNIVIPSSVNSIESLAFRGCSNLISIVVDKDNEMYDSRGDCNAIIETASNSLILGCRKTQIPSSVVSVNNWAFSGSRCGDYVFYIFDRPTGILTIYGYGNMWSFRYISSIPWESYRKDIIKVEINNGVCSIGTNAFIDCNALTNIVIPNSVTCIEGYAFSGCNGLMSISLPQNLTTIGESAFALCRSLESVIIPNSVTSIGEKAFYVCNELKSVILSNKMTSISSFILANCHNLTNITIPSSVTVIENNAFYGCSKLSSIILPEHLQKIQADAFYKCQFNTITIPCEVESIYPNAFSGCPLQTINVLSTIPPNIWDETFPSFDSQVNVPNGSGVNYLDHEIWKKFANINDGNLYYQMNVTVSSSLGKVIYKETDITNGQQTFSIKESSDVTLTLLPNVGYRIKSLTINGENKIDEVANGQLTICSISTDIEVNVSFAPINTNTSVFLANEMQTYCSLDDLDFTAVDDLKAYTATGYDNGTLTVTRVLNAPAGTGLLLKGTAGETYEVPYATSAGYYINLLKGLTTDTWVSPTEGEYTNFLLGKKDNVLTFYRLSEAGTVSGGKAYLQLPTSVVGNAAESRVMRIVEDETTSMGGRKYLLNSKEMNGNLFDLQGRRVSKPKKGLYISQGRKVVIN